MNNQFYGRIVYQACEWRGEDSITGSGVRMWHHTPGFGFEFQVRPPAFMNLPSVEGTAATLVLARAKVKRQLVRIEKAMEGNATGRRLLEKNREWAARHG